MMPPHGRELLALARTALATRVRGLPPPQVAADWDLAWSGLFVTIRHGGDLRGCLGTLASDQPLAEAIVRLAGDVAQHDSRFEPLQEHELAAVAIDLSILAAPEEVADPAEIIVGRHGLIVEQGRRRGLLLPQVAVEYGWDRETFLAHACEKAGLPRAAWRQGARVLRFEALVIADD